MLKFQGQTPIPKACNKRGCGVLSPIEQQNPADTNLLQLIETTIRASINDIITTMFAKLKQEMKEVMKAMIDDATSDMKKQVFTEVKSQLSLQEGRCNLKSLCETELVESYTRRENLRIIGVASEAEERNHESNANTANKVVNIAKSIGAKFTQHDISIAHRLRGRRKSKPIIVRFCRRVAKVEILKKKRQLNEKESTKDIKIFEDLTKARLNFLKLMKGDNRVASAWSREGTLFYQMKNDNYIKKITGLYEGGDLPKYSVNDVMSCFTGVFYQLESPSGT